MSTGYAFERHPQNPFLTAVPKQRDARLTQKDLSSMVDSRNRRIMFRGCRLQIAKGSEAPLFKLWIMEKPLSMLYHQNGKSAVNGTDPIMVVRFAIAFVLPVRKLLNLCGEVHQTVRTQAVLTFE